jgi:hypothetical protein
LNNLIKILESNPQLSCVIQKGDKIREFFKPGVADLFELVQTNPDFLQGACIADKVVGKAAAGLMIYGGVKEVYTRLISKPALEFLQNANIKVQYEQIVEYIKNRQQNDICPLEKMNINTNEISQIVDNIKTFIKAIQNSKFNIQNCKSNDIV